VDAPSMDVALHGATRLVYAIAHWPAAQPSLIRFNVPGLATRLPASRSLVTEQASPWAGTPRLDGFSP
jgi:hypothetical protein